MLNLLHDSTTDLTSGAIVRQTIPAVRRHTLALEDLSLEIGRDEENKRTHRLMVDGEMVGYTERFQTSLLGLLGQGKAIFDLFAPDEVCQRAIERNKLKEVTLSIAQDRKTGNLTALAASKPDKQRVMVDDIMRLVEDGVERFDTDDRRITGISYADGVVTLRHQPTIEMPGFEVAGDLITPQFYTDIPIDGYGNPSAYVGMIRQVCLNGMIAMAKAFKNTIQLGNGGDDSNPFTVLSRFFMTYNNEDGYSALRQRLDAAAISPSSLDEFYKLFTILNAARRDGEEGKGDRFIDESVDVAMTFNDLGGDVMREYGLTSLNAVNAKMRQRVPIKDCTVYDLINVATEVASHHCDPSTARKLHGFVGTTIGTNYDLEGLYGDSDEVTAREHRGTFFSELDAEVEEELAEARETDNAVELLDSLNLGVN